MHVHLYTDSYLADFLGWYEGNLLAAQIRVARAEQESAMLLAAANVTTLGQS